MNYLIKYVNSRLNDYVNCKNNDAEWRKQAFKKCAEKYNPNEITSDYELNDELENLARSECLYSNIIADLRAIQNMLIDIQDSKK